MLPVAILAGGLATRLRPLTQTLPKALLPVAGRPFIHWQLSLLAQQGVTQVVLCAGHLGAQIQAAVGDGSSFGMAVRYSFDGAAPLGTGGALKRALPMLGAAFFVLYGDSYLRCSFSAVQAAYEASAALGLMTVFCNEDRWERSNVLFRDGRVIEYDKRAPRPRMRHIDYGLSILSTRALQRSPASAAFDLADLYEELATRRELAALAVDGRFYEIGSFGGIEATERHLMSRVRT
ncbi:MAG TPA: nucleotidyltransferase family protein [Steroidobacteraceae bacterium]|jgi:NDP-sugar pyrophosphorylase family protein